MNTKIDALNYYGATKKYPLHFPALQEDIDADVVIIGGGFSGINTALELAEQGITNVVVLEARHLGYGGTGRNGGQVMAGIGHDIEAVKKYVGAAGMETLFKISNLGAGIIRERIRKYHIDADFVPGYGYLAYNQRQLKTLQQWEKEFKAATPEDDIELYTGKDVQQVIGSDVYCGVLKHMGGGHVHSLNLLLGSAQAASSLGVKIFEYSPVVEVSYGKTVQVRTAMGNVKAAKLLWACDSFLNNLEPEIYKKTLVTYSYQIATEPLSSALVERISPLRGAFSDIRPVINYYRLTKENRLLFGSATRFLEYTPHDFAAWNRALLTEVFPYLKDVKIDFAWGGPMACSANLFPQIGTLREHNNVFYVQGYSGFGVTPSHIVCKILAEGINGGSERYRLMSRIPHATIYGRDSLRLLLVSAGKLIHQTAGFWKGRN
ncbi:FAD-binding oxidoreductase [Salmonella enterica]|nr:FAD-binding oxidoreductase [Salmonella enterica]ECJ5917263.1 FAD-binding oxidoreductase [Salmonella enterica subsp. salamae]HCM1829385.1 FAD-binding oxidoreductase [Salmonella enterica subsp. salamae serovar 48:z81:z39]HCM1881699.1 FAD-binding oxidoreductase [Salmonella enterica subsp. salamae serovar 60:z10:z39]EAN4944682.1 FAD-binding oxidoreductase [Salmonella enterica]